MPTPRTRHLLLGLALLAPAQPARADVAPPEDYVDPCKSAVLDASCRRCSTPEFKDPGCHEDAKAAGESERCRGWGYAMYCGGDAPALAGPSLDPGPAEAPSPTPEVSPPPSTQPTPTPTPTVSAPSESKDAPSGEAPPAASGCTVARSDAPEILIFALVLGAMGRRRRARHVMKRAQPLRARGGRSRPCLQECSLDRPPRAPPSPSPSPSP